MVMWWPCFYGDEVGLFIQSPVVWLVIWDISMVVWWPCFYGSMVGLFIQSPVVWLVIWDISMVAWWPCFYGDVVALFLWWWGGTIYTESCSMAICDISMVIWWPCFCGATIYGAIDGAIYTVLGGGGQRLLGVVSNLPSNVVFLISLVTWEWAVKIIDNWSVDHSGHDKCQCLVTGHSAPPDTSHCQVQGHLRSYHGNLHDLATLFIV